MKPVLPLLLASLARRETPQELSHNRYIISVKQMLDLNNTLSVVDPTFGLLANNLASSGMGTVMDANCLQLAIADTAFTNAKSAHSLSGMVSALIYRALERNTAGVGVASELCTSYTPQNKELATFHQHQDPASPGALANNKATVLELARQIALVGGEATEALNSGTFKPGDIGSSNLAGNACNSPDCIFVNDALVKDASEEEISEYVGKCVETVTATMGLSGIISTGGYTIFDVTNTGTRTVTTGTSTAHPTTTNGVSAATPSTQKTTSTTPQQTAAAAPTSTTPTPTPTVATNNYQFYQGAYLGVTAPPVTQDGNGMYHAGSDPTNFRTLLPALGRSCDIQKNDCANNANKQKLPVGPCDTQLTDCKNQTGSASS